MFGLVEQKLHHHDDRVDWLIQEKVAKKVIDALFYHDTDLYDLYEFVVLPNHVHILLRPLPDEENEEDRDSFYTLERINKSLKGYTARIANELLNRTGNPFWQTESYDHWVRDQEEYTNIVQYIQSDPLRSNLVDDPSNWKWSSAHPRYKERLKE